MNDVIPLKAKKNVEANGINSILNKLSGLSLNQNSLLPILFVFMTNKNGAGLNIFNNFSNIGGDLGGILSKFNFSSENIERSLKALNTIKPSLASNKNFAMINTFSTILEAVYKFTTIQELTNNLNGLGNTVPIMRNKSTDSKTENEPSNPLSTIKILDVISELLNEDSKSTVKQAKDMIQTFTMLQGLNGVLDGTNKSGGFNIKDIMGIAKPILGDQAQNISGMGDMIKMMEMFSLFNDNKEGTNQKTEKSDPNTKNAKIVNKTRRKSNIFNKDKAIDIINYDEEDDNIIDDLLDDLMGDVGE